MLTAEDNDLLCRVEGDAPMGRLMRAPLDSRLPVGGGGRARRHAGAHARLLGEDLVAFRDTDGRLGVLDEHCPHRRASLALGRNEECGLRCLYHGWKIDVDGNVVEMPVGAPSELPGRESRSTRPIPADEAGGFVWVWMGEGPPRRAFEPPAWAPSPGHSHQHRQDAHRLQLGAGARRRDRFGAQLDAARDRHGAGARRRRRATATDWPRPRPTRRRGCSRAATDFGFRYVAIRRPIEDAATHDYLRITLFVAPFTVLIPPNNRYNLSILNIPLDDTHTMFYFIAWSDATQGIDQEAWRKFCGAQVGRRPRRALSAASALATTTTCRTGRR